MHGTHLKLCCGVEIVHANIRTPALHRKRVMNKCQTLTRYAKAARCAHKHLHPIYIYIQSHKSKPAYHYYKECKRFLYVQIVHRVATEKSNKERKRFNIILIIIIILLLLLPSCL